MHAEIQPYGLSRVRTNIVRELFPSVRIGDFRVEIIDNVSGIVEQVGFLIRVVGTRFVRTLIRPERDLAARRHGDLLADAGIAVDLRFASRTARFSVSA